MSEEDSIHLKDIARDMREILLHLREALKAMKEAEAEIPEKTRRFVMYYHDIHDMRDLYHQAGVEPPAYVLREIERCSDRYRHLLEELHGDGGAFEKVRQEMAKRDGNRYDYTKQLTVQERVNETGNGEQNDAAQAELPGI